ncbi:glycosyltransferase family 2 protein [Candidatus Woesearchaeota archaeon]|nr:glycosyltransferase family 2 protein [Candidatus Woesearchaeota archaeon]
MEKISIILPTYNEEKTIEDTVQKIKQIIKENKLNAQIVVVNDASTDNTKEILNRIQAIKVMEHQINRGYGASLKTGIKHTNTDWILITDADGTYPIEDIPTLIEQINSADMIVGARIKKGVKIPLTRRPAKKIIGTLANLLVGKKIPDINSGFRIFKREVALKFFHLFPDGFSFTTTITLAALTNNYKVKFVPIDYYQRQGKSTVHPIKDFIGFLAIIIRIMVYFRPLKMFSILAGMLFLIGTTIFLYTFLVLNNIADITVIVILLASLQVFLSGMIAEIITLQR